MRKFLCLNLMLIFLFGCSTLSTFPDHKSAEDRFSQFESLKNWPLQKNVKIYWHDKMIPFVDAQTDDDCAFTIGVLHAHLRLGQMELFKRMSAGRLSESGGPFVLPNIDHLIRILNLQKSAELSLERLSKSERQWLQKYIDGINFFIENMPGRPVTFKLMNFKPEPWTLVDALRVGRIAAADANWSGLFSFLALRNEEGWQDVWMRYISEGENSLPSFSANDTISFNQFFKTLNRSGSNSIAVSGKKTTTGSAIIANDPHLGIFAPNLWLLMGYKSPSFQVIGYMLPSVPVVALGRNKDIAWGGTYMRGISTHLFEVDESEVIHERTEIIKRRFWLDKKISIRETAKGTLLTDHPDFKDSKESIALGWTGQQGSNEFGAFYKANLSSDFTQFRASFEDYAISGLNLTFADKNGNVALIPAIRQPILNNSLELTQLVKSKSTDIVRYLKPTDLPYALNPSEGYIVSANNIPLNLKPRIAFVSGMSDRFKRGSYLLRKKEFFSATDIMSIQADVYSEASHGFASFIADKFEGDSSESDKKILIPLIKWDGQYRIEQREPLIFEFLTWEMAKEYYSKKIKSKKLVKRLLESDDWRFMFEKDFRALDETRQRQLIREAIQVIKSPLNKYENWGDYHVQVVRSPLGLIPFLGKRFEFFEYPAAGGSTTFNKSAFSPGFSKARVTFGAQVRHISDMSNLDSNYFIMLGGNDGWLTNPHLYDQIDLWKEGGYIKLPLDLDSVKKEFNKKITSISPKK